MTLCTSILPLLCVFRGSGPKMWWLTQKGGDSLCCWWWGNWLFTWDNIQYLHCKQTWIVCSNLLINNTTHHIISIKTHVNSNMIIHSYSEKLSNHITIMVLWHNYTFMTSLVSSHIILCIIKSSRIILCIINMTSLNSYDIKSHHSNIFLWHHYNQITSLQYTFMTSIYLNDIIILKSSHLYDMIIFQNFTSICYLGG